MMGLLRMWQGKPQKYHQVFAVADNHEFNLDELTAQKAPEFRTDGAVKSGNFKVPIVKAELASMFWQLELG